MSRRGVAGILGRESTEAKVLVHLAKAASSCPHSIGTIVVCWFSY